MSNTSPIATIPQTIVLAFLVSLAAAAARVDAAEDLKVIRAGIIGCDTSHVIAFTKEFHAPDVGDALAGVKVVAAFPGGSPDIASSRDRVADFTKQLRDMGVEIVDSIDALLERVDVVLLESVDGRTHLAQVRPVLAAGKPVFIDKPLAGSLADAVEIVELSKETGTPFFSSSAFRFTPDIEAARANPEIGEVVGCATYSPCPLEPTHPDLFWYGIHGVEGLFTIMGPDCEQVARTQTQDAELVTGIWNGGRIGTFRGTRTGRRGYGALVYGTKAITHYHGFGGYQPLVRQIAQFFKTGKPPVSAEETLNLIAFMEAADESKRRGGVPVTLESVLEKARAEVASHQAPRPRLLVLTDIGGDPDDQQAMIRLMLYSNEFEIDGLIASASGTVGELKKAVTKPHLIREIVTAYGNVRDQLAEHAEGYPTAESLLGRIKTGNPQRGREAIGEGHDSEGSQWIVSVVDRPDPRPVNVSIWGGQTDLVQALWRVRADRGESGLQSFIAKLRVYDIDDQDKIAGWILKEFPTLFYILSKSKLGEDKRQAAFRGMYLRGDESLTSRDWIDAHVRKDHGPLGALYPTKTWTAPNPHGALKEGDTPSWFCFLPLGLSDPAHPNWGGWGGRFTNDQTENSRLWRDSEDRADQESDIRASVSRWRPTFQADFQARMDWCVAPRPEANHAPVAVVNGDRTRSVLQVDAPAGEPVTLDASGSSDPDGDALSYRWWVYPEAGTVPEAEWDQIRLEDASSNIARVTLPAGEAGRSAHLVLEVRDDGLPSLTSYRRVVLERHG